MLALVTIIISLLVALLRFLKVTTLKIETIKKNLPTGNDVVSDGRCECFSTPDSINKGGAKPPVSSPKLASPCCPRVQNELPLALDGRSLQSLLRE